MITVPIPHWHVEVERILATRQTEHVVCLGYTYLAARYLTTGLGVSRQRNRSHGRRCTCLGILDRLRGRIELVDEVANRWQTCLREREVNQLRLGRVWLGNRRRSVRRRWLVDLDVLDERTSVGSQLVALTGLTAQGQCIAHGLTWKLAVCKHASVKRLVHAKASVVHKLIDDVDALLQAKMKVCHGRLLCV